MIFYKPGKWSVVFAFSLDGSVFPKSLAWALPCALTAVALHMFFHSQEGVMDTVGAGDTAASVLAGFTFILGFLVVFRSQQAYARWWEGGTLLQQLRGEWFNSYSCLLAFCNSDPDKAADVKDLQHQFVRLYSLLYACALHQVSNQGNATFELVTLDGFDESRLDFLWETSDRCEVVLQWIQRLIVESNQKELLNIAPPILSRVFNELGKGIVNLSNAIKIKEFPIPFPLAQMITVMLLFHAAVTPVICAATVKTSYWAGLITFVVTFSYWTINYIAVELEMPFGEDANDLPLQDMQADMNRSLCTLVDTRAQHVPCFDFDHKFHNRLTTNEVDFNDVTNGSQLFAASRSSKGKQHAQKEARDKCASHSSVPRGGNKDPLAHRGAERPDAMADGATALEVSQIEIFEVSVSQPANVDGTTGAAGPSLHEDRGYEEHAESMVINLSPATIGDLPATTRAGDPHRPGCERLLQILDANPKGSRADDGASSMAGSTTASSGAARSGSTRLASRASSTGPKETTI